MWLKRKKEHTALWRIMLDYNVIKNSNIIFDTNLSLGEDTKFIDNNRIATGRPNGSRKSKGDI